uniref:Helicase ATP-binding domain-containing protein n=1 Tax=Rhabditophanes sp. KR3021 TaxID=114890 RepID=A0AC35UGX0_9BILA
MPDAFIEKIKNSRQGLELEIKKIKSQYFKPELDNFKNIENSTVKGIYNATINKIAFDAAEQHVVEIKCDIASAKAIQMRSHHIIYLQKNHTCMKGVVIGKNEAQNTIKVKILADEDSNWGTLKCDSLVNLFESPSIDHTRCLQHFDRNEWTTKPGWNILNSIYGGSVLPITYSDRKVKLSQTLNEGQSEIVNAALNKNRTILCITGPPGTGKTATISEIITQLLEAKKKILVIAPTHEALNNVSNRLKTSIHKDKITHSTDYMKTIFQHNPNFEDFVDLCDLITSSRNMPNKINTSEYELQLKKFHQEVRTKHLESTQLVFSTPSNVLIDKLEIFGFKPDFCILEEAGQIWECYAWKLINLAKRAIVAGDQNQLTKKTSDIISQETHNLDLSIMESLNNTLNDAQKFTLKRQYRMNEKIMRWSSECFYKNSMIADESVRNITLSDISNIPKDSIYNSPLLVFESSNCSTIFKENICSPSYSNKKEADVCVKYVNFLLKNGVEGKDIGIITAYKHQKNLLVSLIKNEDIAVNTVDGFQGQQRQVIIFSFVRTNPNKHIGFLKESKRMNVALTRSKRQFVFVGNTDMLDTTNDFKHLKKVFLGNAKFIRASTYLNSK